MSGLDLGTLLSVGGQLAGGFFGNKASKRNAQLNRLSLAETRRQFDQNFNHAISARVADAKRAGLHPLFALGGGVGASGGSFAPIPESGSALGTGIAAAATAAGRGLTKRSAAQREADLFRLQQREVDSRVEKNQAEAGLALAETKRLEQQSLSTGLDLQTLGSAGLVPAAPSLKAGPKVTAVPRSKPKPPTPLPPSGIPARGSRAQESVPAEIPVRTADGRIMWMFNPEVGMDDFLNPNFWRYGMDALRHLPAEVFGGAHPPRRFRPKFNPSKARDRIRRKRVRGYQQTR